MRKQSPRSRLASKRNWAMLQLKGIVSQAASVRRDFDSPYMQVYLNTIENCAQHALAELDRIWKGKKKLLDSSKQPREDWK